MGSGKRHTHVAADVLAVSRMWAMFKNQVVKSSSFVLDIKYRSL